MRGIKELGKKDINNISGGVREEDKHIRPLKVLEYTASASAIGVFYGLIAVTAYISYLKRTQNIQEISEKSLIRKLACVETSSSGESGMMGKAKNAFGMGDSNSKQSINPLPSERTIMYRAILGGTALGLLGGIVFGLIRGIGRENDLANNRGAIIENQIWASVGNMAWYGAVAGFLGFLHQKYMNFKGIPGQAIDKMKSLGSSSPTSATKRNISEFTRYVGGGAALGALLGASTEIITYLLFSAIDGGTDRERS